MDAEDDVKQSKPRPPPLEIPTITTSNNSGGPKTPTPGPSSATGGLSGGKSKTATEKKIGHRRINEGGNVTYKKIETSQIMGSIQLGIQQAIGGLASKPERDLLMQDFMTVEQAHFSSSGSNMTPAHHYSDFRFKTYAPIAFRYFRDLFGIQPDDFLMSLCSQPLRELSNPGASGSIFYLTADDEFIIKTVMLKECDFLQKLLPGYYMNLNQNPRTLLPKFFGLYCYQCNSKNVRLCAMNNLLPSSVKMHQKYDLKGSTYKRKASKAECQKAHPTYKDLDFIMHHPEGIFLEADTCNALIKTMQRDCRVLESFKIMDYSLLVGIHNLDIAAKEKAEQRLKPFKRDGDDEITDDETGEFVPGSGLGRTKSINRQKLVAHSTALESIQAESEPIDAEEDVPPGGIPARNAKGERLLLFLGLIDILQSYRLKKKLEHTFKAMIHDGDTVSVHRPSFYAERFMNFMIKNVFKKIPSPLKHSPSKKRIGYKHRSSLDQPDKIECHDEINGNASTASIEPLTTQTPSNAISKTSKTNIQDDQVRSTASATSVKREATRTSTSGSSGGGEPGSSEPTPKPTPIPLPSPRNYPAVLTKERPLQGTLSSTPKSKVPPPVPPRTPKRSGATPTQGPPTASDKKGGGPRTSIQFDAARKLNPDQVIETVSASDVYVETLPFRSSLSVASSSTTSGVLTKSPTSGYRNTSGTEPSWTEGTPSYTTSSSDSNSSEGCPETPVKRNSAGELDDENENQMTHL